MLRRVRRCRATHRAAAKCSRARADVSTVIAWPAKEPHKGPDLSDIGSTRNAAQLEKSILDPNDNILPQERYVRAVTKDGKTVTGMRLNEDTHNVLLIDEHGRLVALSKDDLKEYTLLKTFSHAVLSGKTQFPGSRRHRHLFGFFERLAMNLRIFGLFALMAGALAAQVTNDRLLHTDREPQNWLTYSGSYSGQRYSLLNQITPQNVKNLELQWVFQARSLEKFEDTPLVVDGVMYIVEAPNHLYAMDAKSGRSFWDYDYRPSRDARPCCGSVNRGVAILGDTLFMATLDAHLVAIDAKTGRPLWNTVVGDPKLGYVLTHAPLVVKNKVSSAWRAASTEFADSSPPMMPRPAKRHGNSTPSPAPGKKEMKPGPAIRGVTAACPPGSPVLTIPPST